MSVFGLVNTPLGSATYSLLVIPSHLTDTSHSSCSQSQSNSGSTLILMTASHACRAQASMKRSQCLHSRLAKKYGWCYLKRLWPSSRDPIAHYIMATPAGLCTRCLGHVQSPCLTEMMARFWSVVCVPRILQIQTHGRPSEGAKSVSALPPRT